MLIRTFWCRELANAKGLGSSTLQQQLQAAERAAADANAELKEVRAVEQENTTGLCLCVTIFSTGLSAVAGRSMMHM